MHKIPYSREDAVTVEGGGTGIPLIIREMASRALGEPKFEASPDRFTVTLARYGVEYQQNHQWLEHLQTGLDRHEQTILLMLRRQGTMNVEQLHTSLRIDSDDIRKILTILIAKGLVRNSDNGAYTLTNDNTTSAGVSTQTPASPCRCRHGDCHRTSVQQKPSIQARIITIAAITVSAEGFATKWLK